MNRPYVRVSVWRTRRVPGDPWEDPPILQEPGLCLALSGKLLPDPRCPLPGSSRAPRFSLGAKQGLRAPRVVSDGSALTRAPLTPTGALYHVCALPLQRRAAWEVPLLPWAGVPVPAGLPLPRVPRLPPDLPTLLSAALPLVRAPRGELCPGAPALPLRPASRSPTWPPPPFPDPLASWSGFGFLPHRAILLPPRPCSRWTPRQDSRRRRGQDSVS